MQVNTYLNFNGNCEAAFKFYAEALSGTIDAMMPHEGTPAGAHVPADWRDKILHASSTVGSTVLMGSDAPPDRYQKPQGGRGLPGIDPRTSVWRARVLSGEPGKD